MNYYVVSTGRTGSTLLCKYLQQLRLGYPYELANDAVLSSRKRTLEGLKSNVEARRVDGVCGAKVAWGTLTYIDRHIQSGINAYELLYDLLEDPRFIYMYRRDAVAQGVSMVKHKKLDRFHVKNGKDRDVYDEIEACLALDVVPRAAIDAEIVDLWTEAQAWELFFDRYKIQPFPIAFEDFIANKMGTLETVCHFLQWPMAGLDLDDPVQSVRTAVNGEWYAEVLSEFTDLF